MSNVTQMQARPSGRPCSVCALGDATRLSIELELAAGKPFRVIARAVQGAVQPDALRRHVTSGHLREELQGAAERSHGLDAVSLAERVYNVAQRAREVAVTALDAGHHTTALRSGESELKALSALAALGFSHERDLQEQTAFRDTARAVLRVARRSSEVAEAVAVELEHLGHDDIAADVRQQAPTPIHELTQREHTP